jgi:hypothetical protein
MEVKPLRYPPRIVTRRSISRPAYFSVPLKAMCSRKWLIPASPGGSCRSPTRYQMNEHTRGAE